MLSFFKHSFTGSVILGELFFQCFKDFIPLSPGFQFPLFPTTNLLSFCSFWSKVYLSLGVLNFSFCQWIHANWLKCKLLFFFFRFILPGFHLEIFLLFLAVRFFTLADGKNNYLHICVLGITASKPVAIFPAPVNFPYINELTSTQLIDLKEAFCRSLEFSLSIFPFLSFT